MSKPSSPMCEICRTKIALYHCPRCGTSTCSLECCRAHKKKGGSVVCDGKRDRTKFCSLKGFNDAQLASDYHFLEDVLKISEGSKRLYDGLVSGGAAKAGVNGEAKRQKVNGGALRSTKVELASISQEVPAHPLLQATKGKSIIQVLANGVEDGADTTAAGVEHKALTICSSSEKQTSAQQNNKPKSNASKVDFLVRQAELKGVNLLRMPPGMQRRLSNTSKYNKKNDTITWKIELRFHSRDNGVENGIDEKSDKDKEATAVAKTKPTILTVESSLADSSTLAQELGKHLDVLPGNATTRSTLRSFVSASRKSLLLFMKYLPCSSAAPKYCQLDPNATLAESLKGKTIIEFPTVEVALEKERDLFPLMISELS